MRQVRRGTVIFWRVVALVQLVLVLILIRGVPHGYSLTALLLYLGLSLTFVSMTWVRQVYSHPAFVNAVVALSFVVIFIDAWLRHSRVTSLYGCLAALLVVGAIAALWVGRGSGDPDDPELKDGATPDLKYDRLP
jgi:hypothetical protein